MELKVSVKKGVLVTQIRAVKHYYALIKTNVNVYFDQQAIMLISNIRSFILKNNDKILESCDVI